MNRPIASVLLLVFCTCHAGAAEAGLRRWAVVASPGCQKSGLADLLTAKLSTLEGIELVERAELDAVVKELALSNLLGSKAAAGRLKLGRLLRADALVLLADETTENKRVVRLVISDCRLGARLRIEHLPFGSGKLGEMADSLARSAAATRRQFAAGVTCVIGVSHFVSKNLVHDYDRYQTSLARLLESGLSAFPGVAVIETEEARAIRQELALEGPAVVERVVPLVAEGEFEVDPRARPAPTMRLCLRISDAARVVKTIERASLTFLDAAKFLSGEAPSELLGLARDQSRQPLSPEAQCASLAARAEAFARLGAWEHAVGLREAALLLRPDAAEPRVALVEEYSRIATAPFPPGTRSGPGLEPYETLCSQRRANWHPALEHFEHLVRNQKIAQDEAIRLAGRALVCLGIGRGAGSVGMPQAEAEKKHFLKEVYPLILKLGSARPGPGPGNCEAWQKVLIETALTRYEGNFLLKEDLDYVLDLMENVVPATSPPADRLVYLVAAPGYYLEQRDGRSFSKADFLEFLGKLKLSSHARNAVLGQLGELWLKWLQAKSGGVTAGLLGPARELETAYTRLPRECRSVVLDEKVSFPLKYIERTASPSERPTSPTAAKPQEPERTTGRLVFEPIELQIVEKQGATKPFKGKTWRTSGGSDGIRRLLPCSASLDVLWQPGAILLMKEKGLAREVLVDAKPIFDDVKWDGESIWIGTLREGIWVMAPSGSVIARIGGSEGLPPCERAILLHPLGPGKAVAIGSLGEHTRAWCAIVERSKSSGRVNVFHRATRVPQPNEDRAALAADPTLVFRPGWIIEYQAREKDRGRILLVGRNAPSVSGRRRPLEIDLATLKVSVSAFEVSEGSVTEAYVSRNGELLEAGGFQVAHYAPPGTTWENGKPARTLCNLHTGGLARRLLPYQGALYVPGITWFRIDPATLKEERLVPGRLPMPLQRLVRFGVSTHYGLVAWDAEAFYRITVNENVP